MGTEAQNLIDLLENMFGELDPDDVDPEQLESKVTKVLQGAFYWFLPCRDLLPVSLFCIRFPGFLVPRRALLFWGIFVRGLHVETFVRVLRSSELSLNKM